MSRAVVANADGAQPVVDPDIAEYQRSAVSALMDHDGVVPDGSVGDELLVRDPSAPFGLRLDADAAFDAFERAWRSRSVVLVEASDVLRADLYGAFTTTDQLRALKARARCTIPTRSSGGCSSRSTARVMRWWSSGRRRRGGDRV